MSVSKEREDNLVEKVDDALSGWCQGDVGRDTDLEFVFLADLSMLHSRASVEASRRQGRTTKTPSSGIVAISDRHVEGFVILTQTCDLVRSCKIRPYVEIAPLVVVSPQELEDIRRLKKPAFAYVPSMAADHLVADVDRVMTVEKAVVAGWKRIQGCRTDSEARTFATALARKRSRFAFPNDFVKSMQPMKKRLIDKHHKQTKEGEHLRALTEIRVRASPSWTATNVRIKFMFIKNRDPEGADWKGHIQSWINKFNESPRFRLGGYSIGTLSDLTAQDYLESDHLDLDSPSISRKSS